MDVTAISRILQDNKEIVILTIVGFVLLIVALYFSSSFEDFAPFVQNKDSEAPVVQMEQVEEPVLEVSALEPVKELSPLVPQITNTNEIKPEELLPKSQDSESFNKQFPSGQGDLSDKNFLIAGYNIGINTVASSLKNANLQLRSDPYIKREDVGPWGQSTIMASDLTNRKTLEIGS